jgi:CTP:molybdopterin cytidylyltransferase MocA
MRGRDKLLEAVDGVPQIRRIACAALKTNWPVIVALPAKANLRAAALDALDVSVASVAKPQEGLAISLRAGLRAHLALAAQENRTAGGLMIIPADMPELEQDDLEAVMSSYRRNPQLIHCGSSGDTRGHPVILPPRLFQALAMLRGDRGAAEILRNNPEDICLTPLLGMHALRDLDTPEEWASWRAQR